MQISRLLYTSHANLRASGVPIDEQVLKIGQAAAARNRSRQITGALVFVEGQFIQVLEGPPDTVEDLFETICCDFNHSHVRLIDLLSAPDRLFADWDMAILSAENDATIELRNELEQIQFMVGVNARVAIDQIRSTLLSGSLERRARGAALTA
ncbi:BLUF domain-containing protein [Altererythrobacter sp. CAU 1778]